MLSSNRMYDRESQAAVDYSKYFVPECFAPLSYTSVYEELTEPQRRRYNQLHGCYCNEQIMFLERCIADPVLDTLFRSAGNPTLAQQLKCFLEEEKRHTTMLAELNRLCFPHLYKQGQFYFLTVPPGLQTAVAWAAKHPSIFPLFVWLMLLEEERMVFFGREILQLKEDLEPHFVTMHRAHLADEIIAEVQHLSCASTAWFSCIGATSLLWRADPHLPGAARHRGIRPMQSHCGAYGDTQQW